MQNDMGKTVPDPASSRYHRQLILPGIGQEGQERIARARVLVVGAGALGAAVMLYLVPAGIGSIGIIDHGEVDESNLPRQVLYATSDLDRPKVVAAKDRLQAMNPDVTVEPHFKRLNAENAAGIIQRYDLVIECSDYLPTKLLVNDACVMLQKPCIIGAALMYEGQLSVYNYEDGPTYRCLVPEAPDPLTLPTCENSGVMGMIPGVIGNLQAMEAIKIITGTGNVMKGRMLHFDGLNGSFMELPIEVNPENKQVTALSEYELSCPDDLIGQYLVEPYAFFEVMEKEGPFEVVALSDDQEELCIKNYRWEAIPLHRLPDRIRDIPVNHKLMLVCENGNKNVEGLKYLLMRENFTRVYALRYGLSALRFLNL